MSTPAPPQVECDRHHTALYVGDVLAAKHGIDYDSHASYRFVERQARRP
jgi:hypothetical protein